MRSLLRDEHHVDDIVQESYLVGLRGKPASADVGGWLRGVARKLSLRFMRDERRRRRREDELGRYRNAASSSQQTRILSEITDEVRRLREPFRTAILMRYWQGLPPRRISAELSVPINTVRSRLQVGLSELRRKMDKRHEGRSAWLLPMASFIGDRPVGTGVVVAASAAVIVLTSGAALLVHSAMTSGISRPETVYVAGEGHDPGQEGYRSAEARLTARVDLRGGQSTARGTLNIERTALAVAPQAAAAGTDAQDHDNVGGIWGGRPTGSRRLASKKPEIASAIARGLEWLAGHQDEAGSWDPATFMRHDKKGLPCDGAGLGMTPVGATGLALLAFLGDGHTPFTKEYKDVVAKGIGWLMRGQKKNGGFLPTSALNANRAHAVATFAVAEATGLIRFHKPDPKQEQMAQALRRAVAHLLARQNENGTWHHRDKAGAFDLETTYWACFAMKTARDRGLLGPEFTQTWRERRKSFKHWLSEQRGNEKAPRSAVQGCGMVHMLYFSFGRHLTKDELKMAAPWFALPERDAGGRALDSLHLFLASHATYQVRGAHWQDWSKTLGPTAQAQRQDGNFEGSWDAVGARDRAGGRIYRTALTTLALEAYYRYTRLLR